MREFYSFHNDFYNNPVPKTGVKKAIMIFLPSLFLTMPKAVCRIAGIASAVGAPGRTPQNGHP